MTLVLHFEIFMPRDNNKKKNGKLVVVLVQTRVSLRHLPLPQFSSFRCKNIRQAQRPWLERTVGRRVAPMKKKTGAAEQKCCSINCRHYKRGNSIIFASESC